MRFWATFYRTWFHAAGPVADLMPGDHAELHIGQGAEHVLLGHGGMIPGGGHGDQGGSKTQLPRQLLVNQRRLGNGLADQVVSQPPSTGMMAPLT